jgi:chromosome segregation ATPase
MTQEHCRRRYEVDRGAFASALAVEIDLLRRENADLRQRYDSLASLSATVSVLTVELAAKKANEQRLENRLTDAREENKRLARQLEAMDIQVEDLRSENSALAAQIPAAATYDHAIYSWRASK